MLDDVTDRSHRQIRQISTFGKEAFLRQSSFFSFFSPLSWLATFDLSELRAVSKKNFNRFTKWGQEYLKQHPHASLVMHILVCMVAHQDGRFLCLITRFADTCQAALFDLFTPRRDTHPADFNTLSANKAISLPWSVLNLWPLDVSWPCAYLWSLSSLPCQKGKFEIEAFSIRCLPGLLVRKNVATETGTVHEIVCDQLKTLFGHYFHGTWPSPQIPFLFFSVLMPCVWF